MPRQRFVASLIVSVLVAVGLVAAPPGAAARGAKPAAGKDTTGKDAAGKDAAARPLGADDFKGLSFRSIGPANMGGRVSSIAIVPGSRTAFYVGFGIGGVFKTENEGTTWSPIFDDQGVASIGSIGVGGEDGKVVWVGTGEGNNRNSSSWGNGVYRSTDAGATWTHVGLEETHDIPRLAVDPRNADVCYVAALGHLWGANPERGVYKTSDGGKS